MKKTSTIVEVSLHRDLTRHNAINFYENIPPPVLSGSGSGLRATCSLSAGRFASTPCHVYVQQRLFHAADSILPLLNYNEIVRVCQASYTFQKAAR